jgi:hypothetical protein
MRLYFKIWLKRADHCPGAGLFSFCKRRLSSAKVIPSYDALNLPNLSGFGPG